MPVAGRHNVLDALAAIALAYGRGVECEAIERAFATFQSVRRRMEIKGEANGILVVEDFAHHPTAIRLTLEAARTRWPRTPDLGRHRAALEHHAPQSFPGRAA